jgi:hypothetical protein
MLSSTRPRQVTTLMKALVQLALKKWESGQITASS